MVRPPDNGVPIKPKTRPLQFKRGTSRAFEQINPVLLYGEPSFEKDSYRMKVGDGNTPYKNLPYIGDHSKPKDGKSAYEIWLEEGHQGTVEDFLEALVGESGTSAYEIWLSVGHEGSIIDFLIDIQGDSAYQLWIKDGHEGTVTDFLDSLVGKSAYQIWLDLGNEGSEEDFIASLKGKEGKSAYEVWLDLGYEGSEEDFMRFLSTTTWVNLD
jgi:hypothetical protein